MQRLVATGVDLNGADYDGRTCIHLAASEGHIEVVEYLIGHSIKIDVKDRWGGTPLDDAKRHIFPRFNFCWNCSYWFTLPFHDQGLSKIWNESLKTTCANKLKAILCLNRVSHCFLMLYE